MRIIEMLVSFISEFRFILLATLIIIISFIFFQKPYEVRLAIPSQTSTYEIQEKLSVIDKIVDPITIFTCLLFFATVALWRSTKDLVIRTEMTARQQIRAYILVDSFVIDRNLPTFGEGRLFIKNFGASPAKKIVVTTMSYNSGIPDKFHERPVVPAGCRSGISPPLIIGPDASANFTIAFTRIAKVAQPKSPITIEGRTAFIEGLITYVDVFDFNHETKFLLFLRKEDFGENITFSPWHVGNDWD